VQTNTSRVLPVIASAIASRSWTCARSGTCTDDAPLTAVMIGYASNERQP